MKSEPTQPTQDDETLAKALAQAADELNDALEQAEDYLADMKLGVSASVDLEFKTTDGRDRFLVFAKDGSEWHLLLEVRSLVGFDRQPITTASRAVRIRAARAVPSIVYKLSEEATSQLTETRVARNNLLSYLERAKRK